MANKQISGQALNALKEALTHIYWKKDDLKLFVKQTIVNKNFVTTLDFNLTKREIASEIVEKMQSRLDIYEDDLLLLLKSVSDMNNFSHLERWEDANKKITAATNAVKALREHTQGYFQNKIEKEKAEKRKSEHTNLLKKNQFFQERLAKLNNDFNILVILENKQERGYRFETFLNELFQLFDLDPKCSYKAQDEQIDGAFTHENQDYLIEAKWTQEPMPKSAYHTFSGKVNDKLKTTLGLFISISGFADGCIIQQGSSVILMDYNDILGVLDARVDLPTLIYRKRQHASQTGEILFHPSC